MTILHASRLTSCSVAADGTGVAIGVTDEEGREGALMLPTECLKALIITLPDMMRRALRLQHPDPNLRLVYPVASWEIELSTQPGTFILTLRTPDNFHVSFALVAGDLHDMAEAAPTQEEAIGSLRSARQGMHRDDGPETPGNSVRSSACDRNQ